MADTGSGRRLQSYRNAAERKLKRQPSSFNVDKAVSTFVEVQRYASTCYDKAVYEEKVVTPMVQHLAATYDGEVVGLDFRLKEKQSIERKIFVEWAKAGRKLSVEEVVADKVTDALRFTLVFPTERYTDAAHGVISYLTDNGCDTFQLRNYWSSGHAYRGINAIFRTPNEGVLWELQMHTPMSFDVKQNQTHVYYENFRTEMDPTKKYEWYLQMVAVFEGIPTPDGVLDIGELAWKRMERPEGMDEEDASCRVAKRVDYLTRIRSSVAAFTTALASDAAAEADAVTKDIVTISSKLSGKAMHTDRNLKSRASLMRKMMTKVESTRHRVPLAVIASNIVDALRFMVIFPAGCYVEAVQAFVEEMEAAGYPMLQLRNYWGLPEKDSAIRFVALTKDKLMKFEVQLHTHQTYKTKMSRYSYMQSLDLALAGVEFAADPKLLLEEIKLYMESVVDQWQSIAVPKGVEAIGQLEAASKNYVDVATFQIEHAEALYRDGGSSGDGFVSEVSPSPPSASESKAADAASLSSSDSVEKEIESVAAASSKKKRSRRRFKTFLAAMGVGALVSSARVMR